MSERLTASPSGRCVTEGPMLVAPREVLVCCVLPWSFPARVSLSDVEICITSTSVCVWPRRERALKRTNERCFS